MPSYITQTIDQRPVVLLFNDNSALSNPLIQQLQAIDLEVISQPLAALFSQGTELVKQLHPARVVVVSDSLLELKKIQLKPLALATYIVAGCAFSENESERGLEDIQKLVNHLLEEKGSRVILGTELLISTSQPIFAWQKLLLSGKSLAENLPLTDAVQFSHQVASLLFQPHAARFQVITSKSQPFPLQTESSSAPTHIFFKDAKVTELSAAAPAAVFHVSQQYVVQQPTVKPTEQAPEPSKNPLIIPIQGTSSGQAPHRLSRPRAELPDLAATAQQYSGVVRTTPVYIPRVQNRLRVYEQRRAELSRQQTLKSKLIIPTKSSLIRQANKKPVSESNLSEAEIEQVVQTVFKVNRQQDTQQRRNFKVEKVVEVKKKSGRRKRVTILLGILLGILIFSGVLLSVFAGSTWWMSSRLTDLAENYSNLSSSERHFRASELNQVSQLVSMQTEAYGLILGKAQLADTHRQAEIIHSFSTAVKDEQSLQAEAVTLTQIFLGKQNGNFFEQYLSLSRVLQQQYQQLSLVTSQLQTLRDEQEATQLPDSLRAVEGQVQDMRRAAVSVQQLDSFIPALFAQKSRRTYAIVMENSQELRPSGGLVESVALLTVDNGQLISTSVYDVNRLDNQLAGTVNPPPELQKYLGQSRLLLRDSSWFADAPTTTSQVRRQLASSTNTQVDGVFLITTPALQKLIEAVGPVTVEDYDEEVTDKNVLTKLEFHSELQLTDQAKEPYSTALTRALVKKITSTPELSLKTVQVLYGQLRQANAMFVPAQQSEAATINGLGWSGTITSPDCPAPLSSQNCQVDTIYQVEANIGINRANASITRKIDEQITLTKDRSLHTRTILLSNNGRSNAWPAGTYKAYMRFFLPPTAIDAIMTVDAVSVPLTADHSETAQLSQQSLGAVVSVPIQKTATIVLTYSVPRQIGQEYSYTFFDQKQPGTVDDDWTVKIMNQTDLRPIQIAPEGEIDGNTIMFKAKRDKHQFVGIKFSP